MKLLKSFILYFIFFNYVFSEIYQAVNSWVQLSTPIGQRQDSGVCITYAKVNNKHKIFSIPGGNHNFQIYDVETDSWSYSSYLPYSATTGASMCWDGNKFIYILLGGTTFYRYDIETSSFTRMADTPQPNSGGGAIVYASSGDFGYCYAFFGGQNSFYRYNIQQNKWEELTFAGKTGPGSALVGVSSYYIYASRLGSSSNSSFKRYNIEGNTWENLQSLDSNWGAGGSLCWSETSWYEIYAIRGANSTDFYKYVISENKWYKLNDLPVAVGTNTGNRLVALGDYIYARLGTNSATDSFWRYRIKDTQPPGSITSFKVENTENNGEVIISWIVPGNDGYLGNFDGSFIIQFSSFSEFCFSTSTPNNVSGLEISTSVPLGAVFSIELVGLQDKTTYNFCIWAKDNYNNFSSPLEHLFYVEKIPLPEAPIEFSAISISSKEVLLKWEGGFCFGYRIEYSTFYPYNWLYKVEVSSNTCSFKDENLISSLTYWYRLTPLNSKKQPYYEASKIAFALTYPQAPVDFKPIEVNSSSITWSWKNLSACDGVRIYDQKNVLLVELPSYIETYTETNLTPNTIYERKIVSFNSTGESLEYSFSKTCSLAVAISSLKVKDVSEDFVILEWGRNDNPQYTRFGVFYSVDGFNLDFSTYVSYQHNFSSTSIVVAGLKPSTKYLFRVVAYNQQEIATDYIEISTKTKDISEVFEILENFDKEELLGWKLKGVTKTTTRAYSLPYSISNFTSSNYLYSPLIENPIKISFMLYATGSSSTFRVQLSSSQPELDNNWFTIYSTTSLANSWQLHEVNLYGYKNIYLRMNRSSGQNSFNLDDFKVVCIPNRTPPATISDLEATTTLKEGEVLLSWSFSSQKNEEKINFIIKVSSNEVITSYNFENEKFYTITISTYITSCEKFSLTLELPAGLTYYFAIKAEDIYGNRSVWYSHLEFPDINRKAMSFLFDKKPQPPKDLTVKKSSNRSVLISWTAAEDLDIDHYVLEYTNDFSSIYIATITKNTSFLHTQLKPSCSYYYRVKSVDSGPVILESEYSGYVCVYIEEPKNLLKNSTLTLWDIFEFSSLPKYWSWSGSTKNIKESTNSLVGPYSAEITLTASLETLSQLEIPLVSSKTYYLEVWLKGKGTVNLGIVKGNNSAADYSGDFYIDSSEWLKLIHSLVNDKEGLGGIKIRLTKKDQTGEKLYIGAVWFSDETSFESWFSKEYIIPYICDLNVQPVLNKQSELLLNWTHPQPTPLETTYRIKYSSCDFLYFDKFDKFEIEFSTTIAKRKFCLTLTGLKPSTTYYFAVIYKDKNLNDWSLWFKDKDINCKNYCYVEDLPPLAPKDIKIEALNKKLKLTWSHPQPEDDIESYRVYYSTYEFFSTEKINFLEVKYPTSSILISSLRNNLTYYIGLTTIDKKAQNDPFYAEALESELSEIIVAVPKISPPKELYCVHLGSAVFLSWVHSLDFNDQDFYGYNIYRSTSLDSSFSLVKIGIKTNTYIDSDISSFCGYYYFVSCCDIDKEESSASNIVYAIFDKIPPRFAFVSSLKQNDLLNTQAKLTIKVEDDRFEEFDKKGRIVCILGKYREVGTTKEFDIEFSSKSYSISEYLAEAAIALSVFGKQLKGIEYYFLAKDEYNLTRYPSVGWLTVTFTKDLPEQKALRYDGELIFGVEAEEVIIRDLYGNEVWKATSYERTPIVWKATDKNNKKVESGVYIYQIKTKNKVKQGVVIVVK